MITATDIQTTPPPARPRLYGRAADYASDMMQVCQISSRKHVTGPMDGTRGFTFTIPTDREIELRREREDKIDQLLSFVVQTCGPGWLLDLGLSIRELDQAIEEASK